ncbi:MAG: pirin family protein [Bacteroidetes bacterium]|nr:pirin family protein [Bacteroidota bacterium]
MSVTVYAPPTPHFVGDGFRVHNFIPGMIPEGMARMDPFLMLDYNSRHYFPPAATPRGVGVHPHKGFETVTIAYKGRVAHHDSAGNSGVIGEGDVQWMTAGAGILHKEYHEEAFSRQGGDFQMVQLWVNLPARHKQTPPGYQDVRKADMVRVPLPANAGTVEIIAGSYEGQTGPAHTFSPVHLMNACLHAGGTASFTFPAHYHTALLVIEGQVKVNGDALVPADHFAVLAPGTGSFSLTADAESTVLVLSGEPLREPIAAYGPFVMNTREEIVQAFAEYERGAFGYLAE